MGLSSVPRDEKKSVGAGAALPDVSSMETSSVIPNGILELVSEITVVTVGSNIQSSRLGLVSVIVEEGSGESEIVENALEVSLRLSAVGIFADKSFTTIMSTQSRCMERRTHLLPIHVDILLLPHLVILGPMVDNVESGFGFAFLTFLFSPGVLLIAVRLVPFLAVVLTIAFM